MANSDTRPQMGDEELRETIAKDLCAVMEQNGGPPWDYLVSQKSEMLDLYREQAEVVLSRVRASLPQPTAESTGEASAVRNEALEQAATLAEHSMSWGSTSDHIVGQNVARQIRALKRLDASTPAQSGLVEECTLWHDIVHCPTDGSEWEMKLSHGLTYRGRWSVSQQRWQKRSDKPYEPPCEDKWTTGVGWIWSNLPEGEFPVSYRSLDATSLPQHAQSGLETERNRLADILWARGITHEDLKERSGWLLAATVVRRGRELTEKEMLSNIFRAVAEEEE